MRAICRTLLVLLAGSAAACTPEEPGWGWDVTLTTRNDECNEPDAPFRETLEYVLRFEGSLVELSYDGSIFASGQIGGCAIDYESPVWVELRDEREIRWKIEGTALYRQGGDVCNLEPGQDWRGTETFLVLRSSHPDVPTGCRYTLDAEGVYLGEL